MTTAYDSNFGIDHGGHHAAPLRTRHGGGLKLAAGTAVHTLHAQAKPPVYMVAMNEITDHEAYTKQYLPTAQKTLKEHGGVYVAAGPGTPIDGSLPKGRVVILRWEAWRH
jgi:hypothetical protein